MNRWHEHSCLEPEVHCEDRIVVCKSCSSRFTPQNILDLSNSINNGSGSALSIPPDEPIGQMNLWWPKCVPYTNVEPAKDSTTSTVSIATSTSNHSRSSTNSEHQYSSAAIETLRISDTSAEEQNHYYRVGREHLNPHQLRLVCLSAVKSPDSPIHVELEVYSDDNRPEYEAVSYTWGGENGDSTLNRPVFIGPYWDVLLQTTNCWEMLRFVRPWRGIRMVWVDALCINQLNFVERDQQVAKMGKIYKNCSRVIVYLGPDIAGSQKCHFPNRQPLDKFHRVPGSYETTASSDTGSVSLDREALLRRRYFSRIWVIQELILSEHAIFRIGNTDFWADSHTWQKLPANWQWDSVVAPWIEDIAHGAFAVDNIWRLMQRTHRSQAADPRDRIFGVINLTHTNLDNGAWKPEYSLSGCHVFIGFFAHSLINLQKIQLLNFSGGIRMKSSLPTWLPDWRSDTIWRDIFSQKKSDGYSLGQLVAEFQSSYAKSSPGCVFTFIHFGHFKAPDIMSKERVPSAYDMAENYMKRSGLLPTWRFATDSSGDTIIDSRSGAMSLRLTRVCAIWDKVVRRSDLKSGHGMGNDTFLVGGPACSLFMISRAPLDDIVLPYKDSLFILRSGKRWRRGREGLDLSELAFLVLRKSELPGHCKLVAACQYAFVAHLNHVETGTTTWDNALICLQQSLYPRVANLKNLLKIRIPRKSRDGGLAPCYFPKVTNHWDLLPLLRYRDSLESGEFPDFRQSYISCLPPYLINSRTNEDSEDYFHFTVRPLTDDWSWSDLSKFYFNLDYLSEVSSKPHVTVIEWRLGKKWISVHDEGPQHQRRSLLLYWKEKTMDLRISFQGVKAWVLFDDMKIQGNSDFCIIYDEIKSIKNALKIEFDELIDIVKSDPQEQHKSIGCPIGFEGLQECMEIDGSTTQIWIE